MRRQVWCATESLNSGKILLYIKESLISQRISCSCLPLTCPLPSSPPPPEKSLKWSIYDFNKLKNMAN